MGTCIECEENFDLDEDTEPGGLVTCPKCRTKMEVLNTQPVVLDYAALEDPDDLA